MASRFSKELVARLRSVRDFGRPVILLIRKQDYMEHSERTTYDLIGNPIGSWLESEPDAVFICSIRAHLKKRRVEKFDSHINDPAFADICADAVPEIVRMK